jgi:hypothetical protein
MEFLVRTGLIIDVRTQWYEQKGITMGEVKAIAYLFKVKKELFKKKNHIYELKEKDRGYWFSVKYEAMK